MGRPRASCVQVGAADEDAAPVAARGTLPCRSCSPGLTRSLAAHLGRAWIACHMGLAWAAGNSLDAHAVEEGAALGESFCAELAGHRGVEMVQPLQAEVRDQPRRGKLCGRRLRRPRTADAAAAGAALAARAPRADAAALAACLQSPPRRRVRVHLAWRGGWLRPLGQEGRQVLCARVRVRVSVQRAAQWGTNLIALRDSVTLFIGLVGWPREGGTKKTDARVVQARAEAIVHLWQGLRDTVEDERGGNRHGGDL